MLRLVRLAFGFNTHHIEQFGLTG